VTITVKDFARVPDGARYRRWCPVTIKHPAAVGSAASADRTDLVAEWRKMTARTLKVSRRPAECDP